jgi:hypothetical protein
MSGDLKRDPSPPCASSAKLFRKKKRNSWKYSSRPAARKNALLTAVLYSFSAITGLSQINFLDKEEKPMIRNQCPLS